MKPNSIPSAGKNAEQRTDVEATNVSPFFAKPNVSGSGFSSTKSIVQFDAGKTKGLFISVPYNTIVDECHFKDKECLRFALMVCFGSKNAIPSFIPIVIPEGNYKIIGLSNKLNDSQIEELGLTYHGYLRLLGKYDITVNYSDFSNCWLVVVYA